MNKEFIVGSAIQLVLILDVNTATCTVTVKDSGGTAKVTDAAMTKDADRVYTYVYQSSTTDISGEYTAIAKIVTGDGTVYEDILFDMKEQP